MPVTAHLSVSVRRESPVAPVASAPVGTTIAFLFFSLAVVVAAWRVVTSPNVVRAALALVVVLAGLAPIYLMLAAEFVALVQVLVYVGAVVVLFLFGIMLTRSPVVAEPDEGNRRHRAISVLVATALFVLLTLSIRAELGGSEVNPTDVGRTAEVGNLLLRDFVIPFEAVSVLLLAALIGSIVIARRD